MSGGAGSETCADLLRDGPENGMPLKTLRCCDENDTARKNAVALQVSARRRPFSQCARGRREQGSAFLETQLYFF